MTHFFNIFVGRHPYCDAELLDDSALTVVPEQVTCRACLYLLGRHATRDARGPRPVAGCRTDRR